ncbi:MULTISPECIES: hypothetical protein [unclassified Arcicella]|uniref:hypothetical protein n=1 Tax=unclassified Arcicella TaxID=2644986 RepID=UPI00285B8C93|nr:MULTISPECIES: hypothetical protein [unclassified Arcicella]MDR6561276.1 hypothetical protein [Arcicella sp. BE51]MDR6811160.1 hypothetical protein [Arcicella sp. BE140]MDR6822510.1 hypothetical protein [Arcicella sp. BE139]
MKNYRELFTELQTVKKQVKILKKEITHNTYLKAVYVKKKIDEKSPRYNQRIRLIEQKISKSKRALESLNIQSNQISRAIKEKMGYDIKTTSKTIVKATGNVKNVIEAASVVQQVITAQPILNFQNQPVYENIQKAADYSDNIKDYLANKKLNELESDKKKTQKNSNNNSSTPNKKGVDELLKERKDQIRKAVRSGSSIQEATQQADKNMLTKLKPVSNEDFQLNHSQVREEIKNELNKNHSREAVQKYKEIEEKELREEKQRLKENELINVYNNQRK